VPQVHRGQQDLKVILVQLARQGTEDALVLAGLKDRPDLQVRLGPQATREIEGHWAARVPQVQPGSEEVQEPGVQLGPLAAQVVRVALGKPDPLGFPVLGAAEGQQGLEGLLVPLV
jgi:hypothetical protein